MVLPLATIPSLSLCHQSAPQSLQLGQASRGSWAARVGWATDTSSGQSNRTQETRKGLSFEKVRLLFSGGNQESARTKIKWWSNQTDGEGSNEFFKAAARQPCSPSPQFNCTLFPFLGSSLMVPFFYKGHRLHWGFSLLAGEATA